MHRQNDRNRVGIFELVAFENHNTSVNVTLCGRISKKCLFALQAPSPIPSKNIDDVRDVWLDGVVRDIGPGELAPQA
jgi:hypothetical protein